jgi:hypothetical protein
VSRCNLWGELATTHYLTADDLAAFRAWRAGQLLSAQLELAAAPTHQHDHLAALAACIAERLDSIPRPRRADN